MSLRPPRLANWLLAHRIPRSEREALLGDLEETFRDVQATRGPSVARLRYWRETLRTLLTIWPADRAPRAARPLRGDSAMLVLFSDLRFAIRMLARKPGFTALATLTLAIGIGATTAIFSVVDPVLFRALPYPGGDRLMMIWERSQSGEESNTSFATYTDLARDNRSFSAVAALRDWQPTLAGRAEPERLEGQRVSRSYFEVLGIRPALGRDFRAEEDRPGAERVVVLGHGLWRRRFGGDSALVGRQVSLDGIPHTVVGVMPERFENVLAPTAQLWAPMRYDASLPYACRTCRHLRAVARLRPGITQASAAREMETLSRNLVRAYPRDYAEAGIILTALREQVTRSIRPALLAVLGAVALLLLIACANVTSLLLARAAQRESEFAIRVALGAGQARVLRQLLTESLLLAIIGGAAGIAVAHVALGLLLRLSPADLPRLDAIGLDGRVLAFALGVTTLAGIAAGLAPALHVSRRELHGSIKRGGHKVGGPHLTRRVLVIGEIALALILAVGAGLLFRSLDRLLAVRPGLNPEHVLTMEVQTSGPRYDSDTTTRAFFASALDAVRGLPGVESAAFVSQLPLGGNQDSYGVHIQAKPLANPELAPYADRYAVSAAYLETMRIPLLRGRPITTADRGDAPAVVLINETFARRAWPGENPIGQRVRTGSPTEGPWRTIVGIVGDVHHASLDAKQTNQVYVPAVQWRWADGAMVLVARTRGDPAALASTVRNAVWSVDKDQAITKVATMERVLAASAVRRRFALVLFETFAAVALGLAAAGIYGVLSARVAERTREIGIRAALGASSGDILRLVVGEGIGLAIAGIALGAAASLALTRLIGGLLFGVQPTDPLTFATVGALLLGVALAACWLPARRATRLDPVMTLRME